jgi:hypothetical protein
MKDVNASGILNLSLKFSRVDDPFTNEVVRQRQEDAREFMTELESRMVEGEHPNEAPSLDGVELNDFEIAD